MPKRTKAKPDLNHLVKVAADNGYSTLFVPSGSIPESWMADKGIPYVVFLHDSSLWQTFQSLVIAFGSRHSFGAALSKCLEELDLIPSTDLPGGYIYIPEHNNSVNEFDDILKSAQSPTCV